MSIAGQQPAYVPPPETPGPGRAAFYYSDAWWTGSQELPMRDREDAKVLSVQLTGDGKYRAVAFDAHSGHVREDAVRDSLEDARGWCADRVPAQSEDGARAWLREEARRAGAAHERGEHRDTRERGGR